MPLYVIPMIFSLAIPAVVIWYLLSPRSSSSVRPIWWLTVAACGLAVFLQYQAVVPVGYKLAQNNQVVRYEEYGGHEAKARVVPNFCERDGDCEHHYKCDVRDWTTREWDSKKEKYVDVEHHEEHQCPYVKFEEAYVIDTTIKYTPDKDKPGVYQSKTIASGRFPNGFHRWRGDANPRSLVREAGVGAPQAWLDAQKRILEGRNGPVFMKFPYKNFILAAEQTTQRQVNGARKQFEAWKLIPKQPDYTIRFPYTSNKVYFEGFVPPNAAAWQAEGQELSATLGTRQGDLQVVLVKDARVADPGMGQSFVNAVLAAWQDKQLGRDAISKNGVIVAIHTLDGQTVNWAAATTGMPIGNEALALEIRDKLKGKPLTPESILGNPSVKVAPKPGGVGFSTTVIPSNTPDSLEDLLFFGDHSFLRRCMECKGNKGAQDVGFSYLMDQVKPTGGQVFLILFADLFLTLFYWSLVFGLQAFLQSSGGSGFQDSSTRQASVRRYRRTERPF